MHLAALGVATAPERDGSATHDGDAAWHGGATKSENEEESVFWYRWPGHSFGFSSHPDLWLWYADSAIKQRGHEERSDDRLSWNLETRSTGG